MIGRLANWARRLREGADAAIEGKRYLRELLQLRLREQVKASPHYADSKRLVSSGFKVYSQGNEDGMIAEIFRRIGVASLRFLEIGIEDGLECNTAFLLVQGWTGVWIDASEANVARAREHYRDYPVQVHQGFVTAEGADEMIVRLAGSEELDLLSIDIDSNDYWVWQSVNSVKPRVVVIEYNSSLPPFIRKSVAYPSTGSPNANYFGASLGALEALGVSKGYCLVGCSPEGINAFFVRADLVGEHFCAPFTAANHYEPPRYDMAGPFGHGPKMGKWVDV